MESPGCTMPSSVRCTSFLLFSAAIALHRTSPTVNHVTASRLGPVTWPNSAAESPTQQDGSSLRDVTLLQTPSSSATA